MKNKNGYTIIELIVVIAVVGIFAFVAINKASYAFSDNVEATKELEKQKTNLIENAAVKYGEDNKDSLFEESSSTYIRVIDLLDNNYLLTSTDKASEFDGNQKIQLVLKDEKIEAHLEN